MSTSLAVITQQTLDGICASDHLAIVKIQSFISKEVAYENFRPLHNESTLVLMIERDIKDGLPTFKDLKIPGGIVNGKWQSWPGVPKAEEGARYLLGIRNMSSPVMPPLNNRVFSAVLRLDETIDLPTKPELQQSFGHSGHLCAPQSANHSQE